MVGATPGVGSIAWVATDPDAIKKMITDNGDGTFTVHFPDGEDVTVDRWFAGNTANAVWIRVIEKAYSMKKVPYKNYEHEDDTYDVIDGGNSADAMTDLFGYDTTWIDPEDNPTADSHDVAESDAVKQISTAIAKGDAVTATIPEGTIGLGENHAFSVIGLTTRDGVQYVQLRNPWAQNIKLKTDVEAIGGIVVNEAGLADKDGAVVLLPVDQLGETVTKISIGHNPHASGRNRV